MAVTGAFLDGTTWTVKKGIIELHMKTVSASMEAKEVDHTGSLYDPAFMITAGGKQSLTLTLEGPLEIVTGGPLFTLREIVTFTYQPTDAVLGISFLGVILGEEISDGEEGTRISLTVRNRGEFTASFNTIATFEAPEGQQAPRAIPERPAAAAYEPPVKAEPVLAGGRK